MGRYESLKNNRDFQSVYRTGKSYANKYLVMYILENRTDMNRVGISVSKKGREQYRPTPVDTGYP